MSKISMYLKESQTVAYWISPKGEIVDVSTSTHIEMVMKNPEKFGTTTAELEREYEKSREPWGTEGKAREKIIIDLVKRGWIRVRKYPNGYSVNVARINDKKTKDVLFDWAVRITSVGILGVKERDMFNLVNILGFVDGKEKSLTFKDIQQGEMYEGTETFDIDNCIIICENIKEVK